MRAYASAEIARFHEGDNSSFRERKSREKERVAACFRRQNGYVSISVEPFTIYVKSIVYKNEEAGERAVEGASGKKVGGCWRTLRLFLRNPLLDQRG